MTAPEGQRERGLVTIAHIAETAGVSAPTVSNVLNGRSGVSEQTRARVEELIEQHGYRKPPAAWAIWSSAAREAGLRVPEDLSVVGFDGFPVGEWVDPPLTTVHRPLAEMAAAATELALNLGRGEQPLK